MTGNPGHRRKERLEIGNEFRPPLKLAPPPRHLNKVAKKEYRRLGAILLARGTIAEVDRGCLAMLATSWATHIEAELAMAAMSPDELVNPTTGRQHPLLRISYRAMQQTLMLSKAFGLTPASRGSVSPSGPPEPGRGVRVGSAWSQFDVETTQR